MQISTTFLTILISSLTGEAREIAQAITKRDGSLLRSKPSRANGRAKYVWRMVAFSISPNPRHQCIPRTAVFDLCEGQRWTCDGARREAKELDALVNEIIATVPKQQWHGVRRWAAILG